MLTWNESSLSILKPPDHWQWETSFNLQNQGIQESSLAPYQQGLAVIKGAVSRNSAKLGS